MSEKDVFEILGEKIKLGESKEARFSVAKLHSNTNVEVPVIIQRSKIPGPTVLLTAGIHGDEINGIEIVRQIIAKKINKPKRGTIICVPVINIFGFINMTREFPDGRDLNRVFPGSKTGSLASQVAHKFMNEIAPHADLILDFHTGGAKRFNAPQIRIVENNPALKELAELFGAPFVLYSKHINRSFRNSCYKKGIPMLLFEGGKSSNIDDNITNTGVKGIKRVLHHLEMLNDTFIVSKPKKKCVFIKDSTWQRAKYSGLFKPSVSISSEIEKGQVLGHITDPYGKLNHAVKASYSGYIINVNKASIVYKGDALFHITKELE